MESSLFMTWKWCWGEFITYDMELVLGRVHYLWPGSGLRESSLLMTWTSVREGSLLMTWKWCYGEFIIYLMEGVLGRVHYVITYDMEIMNSP